MITVLIAAENIWQNEQLASCVLRRAEQTVTLLCPANSQDAWELIRNEKQHHIDMFIISVKLKPLSGHRLAEKIRRLPRYQETPILFLTGVSYDLVGFSYLSTKNGHKTHNYISLPLDKIDAQGKIGLYLEDIIAKQLAYGQRHRTLLLAHNGGTVALSPPDLFFAEVQDKVCTLHTRKGAFQLKRKGLTEVVALVRFDSFVRCHKSFALNVEQLSKLMRLDKRIWTASFQNYDGTCPVSKTYYADIVTKMKDTDL